MLLNQLFTHLGAVQYELKMPDVAHASPFHVANRLLFHFQKYNLSSKKTISTPCDKIISEF